MTAADDKIVFFFFKCFSEQIRLDISYESSARQRIHMIHQALFSSKVKKNKSVVCCNLRVNEQNNKSKHFINTRILWNLCLFCLFIATRGPYISTSYTAELEYSTKGYTITATVGGKAVPMSSSLQVTCVTKGDARMIT